MAQYTTNKKIKLNLKRKWISNYISKFKRHNLITIHILAIIQKYENLGK